MITTQLAEYAVAQMAEELPPEIANAAKRALIDWFAALFPGTKVDPALTLLRSHSRELGRGDASLPGLRSTAFGGTAAWINGSASHAVEFDDIFRDAIYHPGCPTIAAALAVAEERSVSGEKLLRAITAGYEVSTRIGVAVQPSHYKFFHTTGTVGCFGAAIASSTLCSQDQLAVAHALATSATFAAGLQQAFRSDAMTKALHAGHAAWVGVVAAQGAASGLTGALDILEGPAGFGAAMAQNANWSNVVSGLGERFNIASVTVKNHGCCGHTFAPIDALLALRKSHCFTIDQIESIDLRTYQVAIDVAGNPDPKSAFECKFSIPFVVAQAAKFGAVRLAAFEHDRINDRDVRSLMKRVAVVADPELTSSFPNARAAKIEVRLKDGQCLRHFQPYRVGDPEQPLSDSQLSDKFIELASPVIGGLPAERLLARLWSLESCSDLRELGLSTI
ncbi:MmgE/PrpD family protein [Paraburkholderia caribensis]|uniref:MmgE/PrpD family protein n=1 Tax=Paraburkholderia caribensis TaxID=75105 RepID=UPI00071FCE25|nr:MmgE/PrpD family protein [Paraburkholderia caribensis]ALP68579.1 2-methylcitrate dehydratase [Paraburkholderia caribensis]AUT57938.1 MmgE/PrpD family protein [Paraburkholderia caribensis]